MTRKAKPANPATKPTDASADDLKTMPIAELETKLGITAQGLTTAEAANRLAQYGPNEIAEKKTNPLLKFLHDNLLFDLILKPLLVFFGEQPNRPQRKPLLECLSQPKRIA